MDAAAQLANVLNKVDSGDLTKGTLKAAKESSVELARVIANLPLPFGEDAQKVRFSDLPPSLRELTQSLLQRAETKLGVKAAAADTAGIKEFMRGATFLSQAQVSSELGKMLHALV